MGSKIKKKKDNQKDNKINLLTSNRSNGNQKIIHSYFLNIGKNNCWTRLIYLVKISFKNKSKIKDVV